MATPNPFADLIPSGGGDPFADLVPSNRPPVYGVRPEDTLTQPINPAARMSRAMAAGSIMSPAAPTTIRQDIDDAALAIREGARNVTSGTVGLPVTALNAVNRGGNLLADSLAGMFGQDAEDIPMMAQPGWVRGIQENLRLENELDAEERASDLLLEQRAGLQGADGFAGTLSYLMENPSALADVGLQQVGQVLNVAPGAGTGANIAAGSLSAATQNADQAYQTLLAKGKTPEEAAAGAADTALISGLSNAMLARVIPHGSTFERAVGRGDVPRGNAITLPGSVGRGLAGEAVQGGLSEGADQIGINVGTGRPLGEGLGQSIALGSVLEGPVGGVAGLSEYMAGLAPPSSPGVQRPTRQPAATTPEGDRNDQVQEEARRQAEEGRAAGRAGEAQADVEEEVATAAPQPSAAAPLTGEETREQLLADLESAQSPDEEAAAIGRLAAFDFEASAGRRTAAPVDAGSQDGADRGGAEPVARDLGPQDVAPEDLIEDASADNLPADNPWRYFERGNADAMVPVSALQSTPGRNSAQARKFMSDAAAGRAPRRAAIDVRDNGDGTFTVLDGNGTTTAAREIGLTELPARIVEAPAGREGWRRGRGILPQAQAAELTAAYERAAADKPAFDQQINQLAKDLGGESVLAGIKGRTRAEEKIAADYGGDVSKLGDLLRGTLVFDSLQQAREAVANIGETMDVVRVKDRLSEGSEATATGYRDVNFLVRTPGGTVAEIQVNIRPMVEAKKSRGHKLYEEWRSLHSEQAAGPLSPEKAARMQQLADEQRDLYAEAWGQSLTTDSATSRGTGSYAPPGSQNSRATSDESTKGPPLSERSVTRPTPGSTQVTNPGLNGSPSARSKNSAESGIGFPSNTSSISDSSVQAISVQEAEAAINEALGDADVVVVERMDQLPDATLRRYGLTGAETDIEGLYDTATGRSYVILGNLDERYPPLERAAWAAAHEWAGHHGVRSLAGGNRSALGAILARAGNNPTVRRLTDAIVAQRPQDAALAPEEALSELAAAVRTGNYAELERRYDVTVPADERGTLRDYFQRLIAALRRALGLGADFTDADLFRLIEDAGNAAATNRGPASGRSDAAPVASRGADQTDTAAFRRWFGESEVRDSDGNPQVVYHGSPASFDSFDPDEHVAGWFSEKPDTANRYANNENRFDPGNSAPQVYPVYLSIQNPAHLPFDMNASQEVVWETAREMGIEDPERRWPKPAPGVIREAWAAVRSDEFMAALRENGFDGIRVREKGQWTWAAFEPSQIKSAAANSGAFDPTNPSIIASRKAPAPDPAKAVGSAILRNLTPEERRVITNRTAAKFVELFQAMPSKREMAAVAHAGRAKRGWYRQSAQAISGIFGPDGPRFAALLAALSPQTSVESNLRNALNVWADWDAAGRPTDREAILDIMGDAVEGGRGRDSILPGWINNSVEALTAEDPGSIALSGPKVDSFMRNLLGDVNEVTNDAWMANYALIDQALFSGVTRKETGKRGVKGVGYLAMSARVREAARELTKLTGEEWTPAEVQETVWSWAKTAYEAAGAAGETRTAQQLIEQGALTDEMINSTPDFGTLFTEGEYAQILEEAGYGEQVQQIRAGRDLAAQPGAEESAPAGQAAPFDREAQQRLEVRAARRIDQLRERRREAKVAAKPGATLNIGLSTAELRGGGELSVDEVVAAIEATGAKVISSTRQVSDSEPTLVVDLDRPLTAAEGDQVSRALDQEAIVQRAPGGDGALFGPKAEAWGPYNPDFFVMPDGSRAGDQVVASRPWHAKPQQEDAVEVVGYHYSGQDGLKSLDPSKAGTGSPGGERRRFGVGQFGRHGGTAARVNFYVSDDGSIPPKESAVSGDNLYQVTLSNLYDLEADPRGYAEDASNPDAMEEAVSDGGFDGYLAPPVPGIDTRTAVVFDIGKKKIPVEPVESPVASRPAPTGTRNAVTDDERQAEGRDPIIRDLARSNEETVEMARQALADDRGLIAEIVARPPDAPISSVEEAALLVEKVRLRNRRDEAYKTLTDPAVSDNVRAMAQRVFDRMESEIADIDQANAARGREWGRFGQFRQRMMAADYSLEAMESKLRKAKGEPLTAAETEALKKLASRMEKAEAAAAAARKKLADYETGNAVQQAMEQAIRAAKAQAREVARGKTPLELMKERAEAARQRLKDRQPVASRPVASRAAPAATVDDFVDLYHIGAYHVASGASGLDAWVKAMKDDLGATFTALEPMWADLYAASKTQADLVEKAYVKADPKASVLARVDARNVTRADVRDLVMQRVRAGETNVEAILAGVTRDLKTVAPEITNAEVREKFLEHAKAISPDAAKDRKALQDLRAILRLQDEIERIEAGGKRKTGKAQQEAAEEVRQLRARLADVLKRAEQADPEIQASIRNARIENLNARIADLEDQIKTGRRPAKRDKPVVDAMVAGLESRRDELVRERRAIDHPRADPETRYQQQRGRSIAKQIEALQDRIKRGDYSKAVRVPRALTEANEAALFDLEQLRQEFQRRRFQEELKNRSLPRRALDNTVSGINLARAIMTSFDLSGYLRQGGFITLGHPIRGAMAVPDMLKAFASERAEHAVALDIQGRPNAPLYKKHKLAITSRDGSLTQMEEAYMTRWLDRLEYVEGQPLRNAARRVANVALAPVRGSGRAYTTFLNKLRADSFDAMAATLAAGREMTDLEGKAIADYVNAATGRASVPGMAEAAAVGLNTVFFAPKLVASRFKLLAGQPLYGGSNRTRAMIAAEYARFLTGVSVVYGLGWLAWVGSGQDEEDEKKGDRRPFIELDPRSSSFGRMRFGDWFVDPLAGLAQVTTIIARSIGGETKTAAGDVKPMRDNYRGTNGLYATGQALDRAGFESLAGAFPQEPNYEKIGIMDQTVGGAIGDFLRSKLAPVPGAILNTITGENMIGQPVSPMQSLQELVTPMTFGNVADAMQDNGVAGGTALTMAEVLGMSVQYRDRSSLKAPDYANMTYAQRAAYNDYIRMAGNVAQDVRELRQLANSFPPDTPSQDIVDAVEMKAQALGLDGVSLAQYKRRTTLRDADGKRREGVRRTASGGVQLELGDTSLAKVVRDTEKAVNAVNEEIDDVMRRPMSNAELNEIYGRYVSGGDAAGNRAIVARAIADERERLIDHAMEVAKGKKGAGGG